MYLLQKVVEYRGKQYVVPNAANWMVTEESGDIYAYQDKPILNTALNRWEAASLQSPFWLIEQPPRGDWKDSLEKVTAQLIVKTPLHK